MKAISRARRIWKFWIAIICLAIAATGLFDLWMIRYCCLNRHNIPARQTEAQQMWTASMPISGQFLAIQ